MDVRASRVSRGLAMVVVVAAASGCTRYGGGTAFSVDGRQVSMRTVDAAASDCAKARSSAQDPVTRPQVRQVVADWYLQGLIAERVAAQKGVVITQAEKDAAVQQNPQLQPLMTGRCAEAATEALNATIVVNRLGAAPLRSAASHMNITLNPALGTYNSQQLAINGVSGSLSDDGTGPVVFGG